MINAAICHLREQQWIFPYRPLQWLLLFSIASSFFVFRVDIAGSSQIPVAHDFYYFYPDSSQNNLSQLKREVDLFFRKAGYNIHFQPFSHLQDFKNQVNNRKPSFLFVPTWFYEKNKDTLGLTALLRPQRNGSSSYQKVLLTQKNSGITLDNLTQHTLALTAGGDSESGLPVGLLPGFPWQNRDEINIIYTAKDADALFAVALGQVDAALVAKSTLETIEKINSKITRNLKILAYSKPIPLPVLCFSKGTANPEEATKLQTLLLSSSQKPQSLFQFNGWIDLEQP